MPQSLLMPLRPRIRVPGLAHGPGHDLQDGSRRYSLWRALWNDGNTRHRPEKIAQVIARSTWLEHCRARDIDISREADCGRGPVGFKFSRGWSIRGLIEVKHISSNQFIHGADTQLPIYLKGEKASA